jgi:acyl carrier protein
MKITKSQLRQIIKEELKSTLKESILPDERIDPMQAIKIICSIKSAIFLAMDSPGFGRKILEQILINKGGADAKMAIEIVKQLEKLIGVKIEDILKIPFAKMVAKQAINGLCASTGS